MKRVISIATASLAVVLLALTMRVAAQDFNPLEKSYLTFSNTVELPGLSLPAGTYTFKLADTPGRNVVQVLSRDEKEVFGQFLFVQAERADVTDDTVVTFKEMPAGTTPAIQYWFYPAEKIGKEFIYPKDQAVRIARTTHQTVLTEEGRVNAEGTVESTTASSGSQSTDYQASGAAPASAPAADQRSVSTTDEYQASAPTSGYEASASASTSTNPVVDTTPEATVAQNRPRTEVAVGTSGTQNAQDNRAVTAAGSAELPRTASPLALSGLLGMLSLSGAFGLRLTRRR